MPDGAQKAADYKPRTESEHSSCLRTFDHTVLTLQNSQNAGPALFSTLGYDHISPGTVHKAILQLESISQSHTFA